MRIFTAVIILYLFIAACDDNSKTEKEAAVDSLAQNFAVDSLQAEFDIENAPEWFKSIPRNDKTIMVRGYGKSRRADIAEEKAMLNAQDHLALSVSNDISPSSAEHEVQQIAPYEIKQ